MSPYSRFRADQAVPTQIVDAVQIQESRRQQQTYDASVARDSTNVLEPVEVDEDVSSDVELDEPAQPVRDQSAPPPSTRMDIMLYN